MTVMQIRAWAVDSVHESSLETWVDSAEEQGHYGVQSLFDLLFELFSLLRTI